MGPGWIHALGGREAGAKVQSHLRRWGFPLQGTGVDDFDTESDAGDEAWDDSEYGDASDEEEIESRARVLRCALQQEVEGREHEVCEGDRYVDSLEYAREVCRGDFHDLWQERVRILMKISPDEAKDFEVERLLQSLQVPLDVVHNVSLQEVRSHIDLWKPAILKEVKALVDSGTIRRLSPEQTQELKRCGLKVLPGKAVFTAKPPNDLGVRLTIILVAIPGAYTKQTTRWQSFSSWTYGFGT